MCTCLESKRDLKQCPFYFYRLKLKIRGIKPVDIDELVVEERFTVKVHRFLIVCVSNFKQKPLLSKQKCFKVTLCLIHLLS